MPFGRHGHLHVQSSRTFTQIEKPLTQPCSGMYEFTGRKMHLSIHNMKLNMLNATIEVQSVIDAQKK